MSILSERLKYLRNKKGLTQSQMAELLNMTSRSYAKYEYGLREPNLETLVQLSKIFDETSDFLLGIDDLDKYGNKLLKELEYLRSRFFNYLDRLEVGKNDEELRDEYKQELIDTLMSMANDSKSKIKAYEEIISDYVKSIPFSNFVVNENLNEDNDNSKEKPN